MPAERPTGAQLLTMRQAADLLGVNERTIRRYISAGRLTAYRVGPRFIRLDRRELDDLFQPVPAAN